MSPILALDDEVTQLVNKTSNFVELHSVTVIKTVSP